jgi:flagellin
MRINNNLMAMNTHRQYAVNNGSVAKATERLSSGLKINRAGDDAAGLAISEKMRAQIRGLNMASKNSNDAISLVQTAEGALTETHSILQRMNELAVQSASDTNEDAVDRDALQAEFNALRNEIDDIANKTTFNNKNLLDGSFGTTTTIDTAASEIEPFMLGVKSISFEGFEGSLGGTAYSIAYTAATDTWTLSGGAAGTFVHADAAGPDKYTLSFGPNGSLGSVTIETDGTHTAEFADASTLDFTVTNTGAKIQTGANAGETLDISISSMQAADLDANLATADISTRTGASAAITSTQNAINTVSTQRANLGAIQNRLEHKINNLNTSSENLQAAESRIRDIDMAKEMTNFTTQNILVQAATAMLAQANSAPQNVLSLLK